MRRPGSADQYGDEDETRGEGRCEQPGVVGQGAAIGGQSDGAAEASRVAGDKGTWGAHRKSIKGHLTMFNGREWPGDPNVPMRDGEGPCFEPGAGNRGKRSNAHSVWNALA